MRIQGLYSSFLTFFTVRLFEKSRKLLLLLKYLNGLTIKLFSIIFILSFIMTSKANSTVEPKETKPENLQSYSFRPLLIQGRKRLVQKTKDLKLETANILETKVFFTDIDFKKRIFSDEGLE